MFRALFVFSMILLLGPQAGAEVLDRVDAVQGAVDELAVNGVGERLTTQEWEKGLRTLADFSSALTNRTAQTLWTQGLADMSAQIPVRSVEVARQIGQWQGRLQHVLALEMVEATRFGRIADAQQWRAAIKLPRHANAVEGLLALQRMNGSRDQLQRVAPVLAREYVIWQITRVRERADELRRLAQNGRATSVLAALRAGEVESLATFPPEILSLAQSEPTWVATGPLAAVPSLEIPVTGMISLSVDQMTGWKTALEARLPDLLSDEDVLRNERLVLKLVRLIPFEYHSGVRDGQVVIPIEYREAQQFTVQSQQLLAEIRPRWRTSRTEALARYGSELEEKFDALETLIKTKSDPGSVEAASKDAMSLLEEKFGLSLRKAGKGSEVVAETVLEIRALLSQSLQAAQADKWRQADVLRLEAYTSFDLEIEARILPRDPTLATDVERRFLDGGNTGVGIKAVLDARKRDPELSAAYASALAGLDDCEALLKVAISPATVSFTAFTIVLREGLEAVVILAALLAGLRGAENVLPRRRVVSGAWLAVVASIATFVLSRSLIQSLSRYGETLEAVISILAVVILLMVTNWVFHKFYWSGWNTKLRELRQKAVGQEGTRWEALSMVGVGFLTVYREGFETTLFLQSLILEGGWQATLSGLGAASAVIGFSGWAIFVLGAKLPYRKLLVVTGVLVVSILTMFLGSTVRLFQTVGWLTIHPIHGLEIPSWMGQWLGLYPSWEGMMIPLGGLLYVSGAWLWVKWQSLKAPALEPDPIDVSSKRKLALTP